MVVIFGWKTYYVRYGGRGGGGGRSLRGDHPHLHGMTD